jgi:CheY-like chemotaxis protein
VLKNLLSNALKFTERGVVRLNIERATTGWSQTHPVLSRAKHVIAFSVTDTGIGIPQDKQRIIFEAFQQADGTTSRKYGGTGLGLSISRELARLLGGEIRLQSAPGIGSTFTLYLPQVYAQPQAFKTDPARIDNAIESVQAANDFLSDVLAHARPSGGSRPAQMDDTADPGVDMILPSPLTNIVEELVIDDDRNFIKDGDALLLIIEDDLTFARILLDLAHEKGLKALVALRGGTALSLAREFKPGAITLDINLPDMAGWTILDRLKHDPATRHIPVHIISGDENRRTGLALGAMSYLEKSLTRESLQKAFSTIENSAKPRTKTLVLVTDDDARRQNVVQLLGGQDLEIQHYANGDSALDAIQKQYVDGIIIDLRLPDMPATELIRQIQNEGVLEPPPVVVYSKRDLTQDEAATLKQLGRTGVVWHAQSPEHLLDQTVLLLHRPESDLSEQQRETLASIRKRDEQLVGKKILVVDDDLRNIFALTSVLEQHGLQVLHAENGRDGIEILKNSRDIDAVLMDIMMPEMDGYETTRAVRQIAEFRSLPIIALTAKAMKGDREKCLQAGASDYVTKPVDLDQLFSVLRVWIARGHESSALYHSAGIGTAQ